MNTFKHEDDSMLVGIYIITNTVNGKKYVGQSWNISARIATHFLGREQSLISNAIKKYGKNAFQIDQIILDELISQAELDQAEIDKILELDSIRPNGYNLRSGGSRGKHSQESKDKMSAASKGKPKSEDHRNNMKGQFSNGHIPHNKGKSPSKETRQKISDKLSGRSLSEETKKKMSATRKINPHHTTPHTEETKEKIRAARALQIHSEESNKKRSETMKGRKRGPMSDEQKEKIRKSSANRVVSEETKNKMRLAQLNRWKNKKEK